MTKDVKKNKQLLTRLIPLIVFLCVSAFLYIGLFRDATVLESTFIGRPVPEFALNDLVEPELKHDKSVLSGQPMLLNVWATWCPTCYAEHKYLNELAEDGVYIVGMNYKDDRSKALRWLDELDNPYKISLYDPDGMLGLDLGVYGAPETFFIDSNGIIQFKHVGDINPRNWNDSLKAIYEQLK